MSTKITLLLALAATQSQEQYEQTIVVIKMPDGGGLYPARKVKIGLKDGDVSFTMDEIRTGMFDTRKFRPPEVGTEVEIDIFRPNGGSFTKFGHYGENNYVEITLTAEDPIYDTRYPPPCGDVRYVAEQVCDSAGRCHIVFRPVRLDSQRTPCCAPSQQLIPMQRCQPCAPRLAPAWGHGRYPPNWHEYGNPLWWRSHRQRPLIDRWQNGCH